MFVPLVDKTAEPPPPKGVSTKEWDRILEKGPTPSPSTCSAPIAAIRKAASALSFEALTKEVPSFSVDALLQTKAASVEDAGLFEVASQISTGLEQSLQTYEGMGGKYKQAFGVPMFNMNQQLAGSPSVAGGMSRRNNVSTAQPQAAPQAPKPNAGQAQAPGGTSAPSMTSTPSMVG